MGAYFARNDQLTHIGSKHPGGNGPRGQPFAPYIQQKMQASGLYICFKIVGKNGAVDGTRTRDPRRDRPVL